MANHINSLPIQERAFESDKKSSSKRVLQIHYAMSYQCEWNRTIPPWTIAPQLPPGQLPPWTIPSWNCPPDNYSPLPPPKKKKRRLFFSKFSSRIIHPTGQMTLAHVPPRNILIRVYCPQTIMLPRNFILSFISPLYKNYT